MPVKAEDLDRAIKEAFPVAHLEIEDQSSGCGNSYAVLIVSEACTAFEGKTVLARHRMINEALKNEIAQIHAFSQVRH
ncbi:bola-like protein [Coniophora puteana RWD-64-598 SS2]|uniref:Bola-like protein n=1 Tax=Coniophora puteana (strain RWD-64-598) TaxID=741705 RepID=A0A5M3MCS0_CONPW|nr:bola-like protein [Coniophora puteana RWD-64-598 SS2]EIW76694.1 bola-like protein [Coniophora puteana RWD-64-598 SS2]